MKTKPTKRKFEQDRVYRWFEEKLFNNSGEFLTLLSLFGTLPFVIFWLGCKTSNSCTNTGNIPMMVGYFLSFFIILELIYIWICKNEKYLEEEDTVPLKVMSFILTSIIMNIIVPSLYGIYILLKDYMRGVLTYLAGFILIAIGLYLFYLINLEVLIYIKDSRKA